MLQFLESQPPTFFAALGVVATALLVILVAMQNSVVGLALESAWLAFPPAFLRRAGRRMTRIAFFVVDGPLEPDGTLVGPGATPIRGRWERFVQHRHAQAGAVSLSSERATTGALSDSGPHRAASGRGSLSEPN